MKIKIITIGVYGFDETGFFDALCNAQVDTFCDIRMRFMRIKLLIQREFDK